MFGFLDSGLADEDAFSRMMQKTEDARRSLERVLVSAGVPFLFSRGKRLSGVAHRSLSGSGWRITWLSGGVPTGHTEYGTCSGMVSDLLGGGWSFRRVLHMRGSQGTTVVSGNRR
jgi:hypothetical protein